MAHNHGGDQMRELEVFADGSLCRIKLFDFLTYDTMEVKPGPLLNVIVGANGAGKSTLVCAICLGLGGNPSMSGRSSCYEDYIKTYRPKAVVEIELVDNKTGNSVVRLEITRAGRSPHHIFFINGHRSKKDEVQKLMQKYRSQVDNLCQFLAQDRVAQFAQQTPHQLLQNTQRAIGSDDLLEAFDKLKSVRERGSTIATELEEKRTQLKTVEDRLELLRPEFELYRDNLRRKELIAHLKQKLAFLKYDKERASMEQFKKEVEDEEKALATAKKDNEPKRREKENAERAVQTAAHKSRAIRDKIGNHKLRLEKAAQEADDVKQAMGTTKMELAAKRQGYREKEERIRRLTRDIEKLQEQLKSDTRVDLGAELRELEQRLHSCSEEKLRLFQARPGLEREVQRLRGVVDGFERQRRQIQDRGQIRLNALRNFSADAYKTYMFIQQEPQKFKEPIFVPLLNINLKDPEDAKFLENRIAYRDLEIFIARNKEDYATLQREARGRGWRVNSTLVQDYPSHVPVLPDEMRRLGFRDFLVNLFDAPREVKQYLCSVANLNNVPVGNEKTERDLAKAIESAKKHNFYSFFTPRKIIFMKRSRYTGLTSCTDSQIRQAKILTGPSESTTGETAIVQNLQKAQEQLAERENKLRQLVRQYGEKQAEEDDLKQKKREMELRQNEPLKVQREIRSAEINRERAREHLPDLRLEEQQFANDIRQLMARRRKALERVLKETTAMENEVKKCLGMATEFAEKQRLVENLVKEIALVHELYRQKEEDLAQQRQQLEDKVQLVRELLNTAHRLAGVENMDLMSSDRSQDQGGSFKAWKSLSNSEDELMETLNKEEGELMGSREGNKDRVDEYNRKRKYQERLTNDVHDLRQQYANWSAEKEDLRERWLVPLRGLVQRINDNFSSFLRRLNYAGEVALEAEDESDVSSYGLEVRVRFREGEELQRLTHQTQSGGERSVSTITYMLALQEMSIVPFRCVDEINQGMDPVNERRIFQLMVGLLGGERNVEGASTLSNTQYFILTPKLLPELQFGRRVTVLVIHSGRWMIDWTRWDISTFLQQKKQLNRRR